MIINYYQRVALESFIASSDSRKNIGMAFEMIAQTNAENFEFTILFAKMTGTAIYENAQFKQQLRQACTREFSFKDFIMEHALQMSDSKTISSLLASTTYGANDCCRFMQKCLEKKQYALAKLFLNEQTPQEMKDILTQEQPCAHIATVVQNLRGTEVSTTKFKR